MPRPSRSLTRSESYDSCEPALDMVVGENEKGLPMCVFVMVRYVLPKFIGTKLTGLVKVRMKIKRYLD